MSLTREWVKLVKFIPWWRYQQAYEQWEIILSKFIAKHEIYWLRETDLEDVDVIERNRKEGLRRESDGSDEK